MAGITGPLNGVPEELAAAMLPDGPDDDVAILVARVDPPSVDESLSRAAGAGAVRGRRRPAPGDRRTCEARDLPGGLVADAALATSELVTNAVLHGRPPIDLRLRIEGVGRAGRGARPGRRYQPRKLRPDEDDEHGRGLQIVAALVDPVGHPAHRARQGRLVHALRPRLTRPWWSVTRS